MKKADISILTIRNIKTEKIKDLVPELYDLKNVVENNDWHDQEPVFDHTLFVLNCLEKVVPKLKMGIRKKLQEIVDINSRENLLWLATVFHDIAKKETLLVEGKIRRCPSHEAAGAQKVVKILCRFNISPKEKRLL